MNEIIKKMIGAHGAAMVNGGIDVEQQSYATRNEVNEAIQDFAPDQGWICFTSKVALLNQVEADDFEKYRILSAELVRGEKSLHIRQSGECWRGWTYTFDASQDDIVLEQQFLGTSKVAGLKLRYQTLWKVEPKEGPALQPVLSRFAGFVKGGQ